MWLLRDAKDLLEAVVKMPEQLRRFDGHPSQEGVQSLRVEQRFQGQRLADVTVADRQDRANGNINGQKQNVRVFRLPEKRKRKKVGCVFAPRTHLFPLHDLL